MQNPFRGGGSAAPTTPDPKPPDWRPTGLWLGFFFLALACLCDQGKAEFTLHKAALVRAVLVYAVLMCAVLVGARACWCQCWLGSCWARAGIPPGMPPRMPLSAARHAGTSPGVLPSMGHLATPRFSPCHGTEILLEATSLRHAACHVHPQLKFIERANQEGRYTGLGGTAPELSAN